MAGKKIRQVVLSGSRPTTAEMIETYGLTRKDVEFVNRLVEQYRGQSSRRPHAKMETTKSQPK